MPLCTSRGEKSFFGVEATSNLLFSSWFTLADLVDIKPILQGQENNGNPSSLEQLTSVVDDVGFLLPAPLSRQRKIDKRSLKMAGHQISSAIL